jgi:Zn-dependent protease with chaperone function
VKEEHAGKRGRCPSCKALVTVPAPPSPAPAGEPAALPAHHSHRPDAPNTLPAPASTQQAGAAEDGPGCYDLADGFGKKAKAVPVRGGALAGVGVGARGVREAAAPTKRTRTPAEVLGAFGGEIAPVRASLVYSLWLLIVAGFMLLLPLFYVSLIGLVILALAFHAVHDITIFQHARGGGALRIALVVYVAPLICGAVLVAFMLKPLFAKPAKATTKRTLDPEAEPLFFAFIDGVCASVGAPRPKRIEVDCEVNAAAGYSGGAFSIFAREPGLVVGLGMVAGLDIRQFAGVMAHELGHISQGSGARLMEVISSINAWFARVVYDRDNWDEMLQAWSAEENVSVKVIGGLSRFAVWLSRRVLWVLLHLGHLVNMVFLRQREYDADRYEARMIGGKTFAETSWRMRELQLASQFAMSDLQSSWHQRRLPDDFPKLILANVPQIPKEMLESHRLEVDSARTGLFDTHPSDRDRIARAKVEEPGDGIFTLDGPATDVFRNFDSLARAATFDFYQSMLGGDISEDQLYPVTELIESQAVAQEAALAVERFFLKAAPLARPFPLPRDYPKAPTDLESAQQVLVQARNDQQAARREYLKARERESEAGAQLVAAEFAGIAHKCDLALDAEALGSPARTTKAAKGARDDASAQVPDLAAQLERYEVAAARRLTCALAILELDAVADCVAEGRARREEARALYPCAAHLGGNVMSQLVPVLRAHAVLGRFVALYNEGKNENNQPLINAVFRSAGDLHEMLQRLGPKVGDTIAYPFEHASEDITLGRFALPSVLPEKTDVGSVDEIANTAVDRLFGLYRRALGRLAVTALEVERVLRLEPIVVEEDEPREPSQPGPTMARDVG